MNRETALLQLMLTPGIGSRSLAKLLARLTGANVPVEQLLHMPPESLSAEFDFPPLAADGFHAARDEAAALAESLAENGIRAVTLSDPEYPAGLALRHGRLAPPILFVRGDPDLLSRPMIGFAGARDCTEAGMALTREIAAALAGEGVNIVSGYAPGIDTAAHFGAVRSGGSTTAVLASGILHFAPRADLAPFCDDRNTLIVSEFFPTMPWRSHSAMQRNKTICGLVKGMVIVESGLSGGTFAAGCAALEIGCPLYVIVWPDRSPAAAGNAELIRRGGVALPVGADWLTVLRPIAAADYSQAAQPDLFCR